MADYLDELQDVLDSIDLVRDYREKSAVREYVNQRFIYKNQRYVFQNFAILNSFASEFKTQYQKIFGGKPLGKKRFWNQDDIRVQIDKYITYCYNSQNVLDRIEQQAIDYYTRDLNLSPAEKASLKNPGVIQQLKKKKKKKEGAEQGKGIQGAKLTPEQDEEQKKVLAERAKAAATQPNQPVPGQPGIAKFEDLGQPLPPEAHRPTDLEVIHTAEEAPTAKQTRVPIENIKDRARVISTQARQILRPVAQEATSKAEIAIIRGRPRLTNFVFRSLGSIGRGIISLPFGGEAASASRAGGVFRAGNAAIRGARGLAGAARASGLIARLGALGGPAGVVVIAGVAVFALLLILPLVLQLMKSNSPCMPDGCRYAGPVSDNPLLTLNKTGTEKANVGEDIKYTLTVTYLGTGTASAQISDKIPDGTQFKESPDGKLESESERDIVKWDLKDLAPNKARLLTFTVTSTRDKVWAVNQANALFQTFPIIPGGNELPNDNDCNGKYSPADIWLRSPLRNFGDPACSMTKDGLAQLLKQLDPEYAYWWFNELITCESVPDYNPNSYSSWEELGSYPETDRSGVWGLFSMGRGKNGQYDRGDVPWQQQVNNAITYKNNRAEAGLNPFSYWACSFPKYFPPYKKTLP